MTDETSSLAPKWGVTQRQLVLNWGRGIVIGTALIAITSPLFIRSYVPKVTDTTRDIIALKPGSNYRWTSEGYATTSIGDHGMAGYLKPVSATRSADLARTVTKRIALWGDSQAEGMCVSDAEKIAALAMTNSDADSLDVLNFARSGDECNDWLHQIETLSGSVAFDAHVFLIVEWTDWTRSIQSNAERPNLRLNQLFATAPAFAIQAVRNTLLTESNEIRSFRFGPGTANRLGIKAHPGTSSNVATMPTPPRPSTMNRTRLLVRQLDRLQSIANAPCLFLYAPKVPSITNGRIVTQDPDEELLSAARDEIRARKWTLKDLRPAMIQAARRGDWPRGFHNGQFGAGHYNAIGNGVIADAIVEVTGGWGWNLVAQEN